MSGDTTDNTLLQWLQDESNDDHRTNDLLASMYSYFAEGADDPLTRIKEDDRHHCFLIFQKDAVGSSYCSVLHHLAQYPTRMGITTPHDGNWYLSEGQPVAGNHINYLLPNSLFIPQTATQVYSPERIQRELGADMAQLVMVIGEDDLEEADLVTTRRGMWIPNQYAALCLEDNLSPGDVWRRVYGALLRNGHTTICAPLVNFLQYHLQGGVLGNTAIFSAADLLQPRVTASFLRHRSSVLSHMNLHGTNAPAGTNNRPASAGGAFGMSPEQFQEFISAMRGGHTAPAPTAGPSAGNTVEKRWSINLDSLLKLTNVSTVEHLPPVWTALAKGPRKEERNILQAALDNHSRHAAASTNAKLTVSKELLSTVVNLSFWSGDFDMLEEGLHPFRTVYVSTAKQAQDQAHLQTYDSLARDGTLRLEDVQLFQLALKSHWPTDYLQLDTSLRLFHNLLAVLVPSAHPLYIAYDGFINSWKGMHILLAEYFGRDRATPAQFLRSMQLRVSLYWQSLSGATAAQALVLPPPNFQELLMSVNLQSWVPPSMPGQSTPVPAPSSLPGPAPVPAPTPAPAPAPAPADSGGSRQREVRNNNMVPEVVTAMRGRSFRIRDLFDRNNHPPSHEDGRPMCCVYHIFGRCSSNCSRAYSHSNLSSAEINTLKSFVQNRIVARDIGRAPSSGPVPAPAPANSS